MKGYSKELEERLSLNERKPRDPNRLGTQKMMSFRLDGDLVHWLDYQPNKGRLINNLLRSYRDGLLKLL